MNHKEIQELIKQVSKSRLTEVEIEKKDFKIILKSEGKTKKNKEDEEKTVVIQQPYPPMAAPMVQPQAIQQPVTPAQPAVPQATEKNDNGGAQTQSDDDKFVAVKSPMIGTFYRSPAPDKPLFVEVGDTIKEGDTICIIEAMKLFNEIEAEVTGKIVKVLVDDSTPVEYDQPLFLVDPS